MAGAASARPQFEVMLPTLEANLLAAKANLKLAEEDGDTAAIEDWRLTVHVHKCAVALNQANLQVLARMMVRCEEELAALSAT